LHADARALLDVPIPPRVVSSVTISTFHGCKSTEIERIATHLMERHGLDVVVKMNPTLLGYDETGHLLHDVLGYRDLTIRREIFASDLQWNDAIGLLESLRSTGERLGRAVGVKFSNTLIVDNHKKLLPDSEPVMYLSGQPLHVLMVTLAHRFTEATGGRHPVSFSAGIDALNFHEATACGFVPITTCTDLLRPGGYGRLPRYLDRLGTEMKRLAVASVPAYVEAQAAKLGGDAALPAWRRCLADYARRVAADPRYAEPRNRAVPRRLDSKLKLFDCINCDKCVPVCPNDANFPLTARPWTVEAPQIEVDPSGSTRVVPGETLTLGGAHQLANFADACNECGNCDIFCPELGGPYRVKPRFFYNDETFRASPALDGFHVPSPNRMEGRVEGAHYRVVFEPAGETVTASDGVVEVQFKRENGELLGHRVQAAPASLHVMPLWRPLAMTVLLEAVLAGVNPVSARFLRPGLVPIAKLDRTAKA
jgi:putative selenate reductase